MAKRESYWNGPVTCSILVALRNRQSESTCLFLYTHTYSCSFYRVSGKLIFGLQVQMCLAYWILKQLTQFPTLHHFGLLLIVGQWWKRQPLRGEDSSQLVLKPFVRVTSSRKLLHSQSYPLSTQAALLSSVRFSIVDTDQSKGEWRNLISPIHMLIVPKLMKRKTLFLTCDQSESMHAISGSPSFFFYSSNGRISKRELYPELSLGREK